MSEQAANKTEKPTPRRLEEAVKRGQIARSAAVQTVFVLAGGCIGLRFAGQETWLRLRHSTMAFLGHLHDTPVSVDSLQALFLRVVLIVLVCAGPVIVAALLGGLLAGGLQSRFQTASEVLAPDWSRLSPVAGFRRLFSARAFLPALLGVVKLLFIAGICWGGVAEVLKGAASHGISDVAALAQLMGESALSTLWRLALCLAVIAAADYAYQAWHMQRELMMTRQELKEELKSSEGDPHMKSRMRRRRTLKTQRQMLLEVPKADVVLTNPTRLAVALRYDRQTMKAPRVVAKGSRLNAKRIREIAAKHQVPMLENKPLARMIFRHSRVGSEIPSEFYAAIAEILAWVYRVNRYRYYAEQNQAAGPAALALP